MARRIGLGPVFAFEWRMASRRWQGYAMRTLTVLLLLGSMAPVWFDAPATGSPSIARQAQASEAFYERTAILLLGLVGLAAPAATAGAICQDKARGNLTLLFATDLSDAEIVLGKLAARLVPVLAIVLCAVPVLAIASLFGGVAPGTLLGALFVLLACAVFGCSLALTLSVWGRKPHEVLMATYAFGLLYLLAAPIYAAIQATFPWAWWPWLPSFRDLLRFNPVYLVLAPFNAPRSAALMTIETQATFLGLGLATSALLLGAATCRVRAVVIGQLGQGERATGRHAASSRSIARVVLDRLGRWAPGAARLCVRVRRAWPRPSLDRNPVLWRECMRKRPSRWGLAVWGLYALLCGSFSLWAISAILDGDPRGREIGVVVNGLQVGAGLLLLSASAATSLAEERQRGSLDVLMATPLPTRAIVWGKWWGAFRAVPPLLILPIGIAAALASISGRFRVVALLAALILAYGAAVTSLGLALATWIPRMGRAASLTVGLYAFMSLGWVPLALIVFGERPGDDGIGIAAGSPIMGVRISSEMLADAGPRNEFAGQAEWLVFWTITYGGVALALLLATLGTFNRCLGRIDDPTIRDGDDSPRDRGTAGPPEPGSSPSCGRASAAEATASNPSESRS